MSENPTPDVPETPAAESKFCQECGQKISKKAVVCPHCGCQVEDISKNQATATPQIVINNSNQNQNTNQFAGMPGVKPKNKWVALLLLIFFGVFGAHKFYEGKIGMGILYLFTLGLCGIGCIIDFFALLFKSNPYYV